MIVRPRPHWLRMLFVWHGSVLADILPQLGFVTGLALAVALAHGQLGSWKVTLTAVPFSLIGVSLAIFLGFRINASYDRYWEARKLWGMVLADTRALTRQVLTQLDAPAPRGGSLPFLVRPFVLGLIGFAHAMRLQLRGLEEPQRMRALLPTDLWVCVQAATQRPPVILLWLGGWLAEQRRAGRLEPNLAAAAEVHLSNLGFAHAGCERIAGTPLPFTFSVIIHRTVYCYCALLPFGLVDAIGIMTPVMVGFVAYAFFALEALSDDIAEPFGTRANDLALDLMCAYIERSLREMVGDADLPPLPVARDWILN